MHIKGERPVRVHVRLGAELVEPRERTEGNMGEQQTYRTLHRIRRVPEARLCTRSCSWDSSLTTRGGSPVRESRPPGSVRGASSNGCPYRDRPFKDYSSKRGRDFELASVSRELIENFSKRTRILEELAIKQQATAETLFEGFAHLRRNADVDPRALNIIHA